MDLVTKRKRSRLMPAGKQRIRGKHEREDERRRSDWGESERGRESQADDKNDDQPDELTFACPERERKDDNEGRSDRDGISDKRPFRSSGDGSRDDRGGASDDARQRKTPPNDRARDRIRDQGIDPGLRERTPDQSGHEESAGSVRRHERPSTGHGRSGYGERSERFFEALVVESDVLDADVVLAERIEPLKPSRVADLLPAEVPVRLHRYGGFPVAERIAVRFVRRAVQRTDDDADTGKWRSSHCVEDAAVEPDIPGGNRCRTRNSRRKGNHADAARA